MRTLWRGGRVYCATVRDASALLVDGGVVAWVGDEDTADAATDVDAVIDLQGALVTPAFVDAHVHLTATGLALTGLDLTAARSRAEVLTAVAAAAATRAPDATVLGSGWEQTRWPEPRPPTAAELDRAAGGRPVYLARVDAHSALVSGALLAGIPGMAATDGYRPDGWLTRTAHHLAREAAWGVLTAAQRTEAQDAALRTAAGVGIGAVHEMAGPTISCAADLVGALTPRDFGAPDVFGYWAELGGAETAAALGALGAAGDLFCDGSFGSHTAALQKPYADAPTSGALYLDVEAMTDHILQCTEVGLQAGFHAIGDAAVTAVVAAMRHAIDRFGVRVAGAGHRIEHAEAVINPGELAAVGLLASVQPAFDAAWGGPTGMYADRLGRDRAAGLNRYAELAAAGVPLAFGSDAPVTPLDPWAAVRAAVHPAHGGPGLSPRAAFAAHTRGGWRAARRDGNGLGTLDAGTPATLAVWAAGSLGVDAPDARVARWSTDPRAAVPGLPDLSPGASLPRALMTMVGGRVVHDVGDVDLPNFLS